MCVARLRLFIKMRSGRQLLVAKRKSNLLRHISPDVELRQIIEAEVTERDRFFLLLRYLIGLRVSKVTKVVVTHLDFRSKPFHSPACCPHLGIFEASVDVTNGTT